MDRQKEYLSKPRGAVQQRSSIMHSLTNTFEYVSLENCRGVAQLGSALGSGPTLLVITSKEG